MVVCICCGKGNCETKICKKCFDETKLKGEFIFKNKKDCKYFLERYEQSCNVPIFNYCGICHTSIKKTACSKCKYYEKDKSKNSKIQTFIY